MKPSLFEFLERMPGVQAAERRVGHVGFDIGMPTRLYYVVIDSAHYQFKEADMLWESLEPEDLPRVLALRASHDYELALQEACRHWLEHHSQG